MGHKLEGNGLWESSRMMLPEHKERIIAENFEFKNKKLPRSTLDEQEWEQIIRVLMESLGTRVSAHFQLYDKYEESAVIGIVERVDPYRRLFSVDGEWFTMADIIGADLELRK
jgi:hypothetical protein